MKRIFLILILFATVFAAQAQTSDQKDVQQALTAIFDGLSAANMQAIQAHTTPDFTILENGLVWNMDTLTVKVAQLKALAIYRRDNQLDFIHTEVYGNAAWVAYHNTANVEMNDKKITRQWLESAFLIKQGGIWKVQLLHSTVIASHL